MSDQVLYDDDEAGNDVDLESIDWNALVDLQTVYDQVNAIADPVERLEAAKNLVASFGGQ